MMFVKKLMAGKFGGLSEKKLTLEKGLNVVFGPNEAGKTSWADLFDVLMFGVPRKTAKANSDFDRNVYTKYDMDAGINIGALIQIDDKNYTFNKNNNKACEVLDEDLVKIPEWSSKTPGEILFDVNRESFLQTSFVKQMQPLIGNTNEIERKLSALVQNVGVVDGVSFTEANEKLDEAIKKITSTQRIVKVLPALYDKRDSLNRQIEESKNTFNEIYEIRNEIADIEAKLSLAKISEKALEIAQSKVLYDEILTLEEQKANLLKRLNEIKEKIEFDGQILDETYLDECKNQFDKYKYAKKNSEDVSREYDSMKNEFQFYESEKQKYTFFMAEDFASKDDRISTLKNLLENEIAIEGQKSKLNREKEVVQQQLNQLLNTEDNTEVSYEDNDEIKRCEDKINKHDKKKKICRLVGVLSVVIGIALLMCCVLDLIFVVPGVLLLIASVVSFVIGAGKYDGETIDEVRARVRESISLKEELRLSKISGEKIYLEKRLEEITKQLLEFPSKESFNELRSEFNQLLSDAGCMNHIGYMQKCQNFRDFNSNYVILVDSLKTKKLNVDTCKKKLLEEKALFDTMIAKINVNVVDDNEVETKLTSLRDMKREYVLLVNNFDMCVDKISTRLGERNFDDIKVLADTIVDDESILKEVYSKEEIDAMNIKLQECQRRIGELKGSLDNSAEMEDLLSDLEECEQKITYYTKEKEALELAVKLLKLANEDFELLFAPKLNDATADYFNRITDGKYVSVGVDRGFGVKIAKANSATVFDGNAVSEGTLEQVYFALRLALIDSIYDENHRPPMFVDDAFVNFDEKRFESAFDLLNSLSENTQIVYFTCKNEVVDYAKQIGVNIIEYSDEWAM